MNINNIANSNTTQAIFLTVTKLQFWASQHKLPLYLWLKSLRNIRVWGSQPQKTIIFLHTFFVNSLYIWKVVFRDVLTYQSRPLRDLILLIFFRYMWVNNCTCSGCPIIIVSMPIGYTFLFGDCKDKPKGWIHKMPALLFFLFVKKYYRTPIEKILRNTLWTEIVLHIKRK